LLDETPRTHERGVLVVVVTLLRRTLASRCLLVVCVLVLLLRAASAESFWHNPVKVVAPDRMTVVMPAGSGEIPLFLSADWSHALPGIRRAVIVVPGIDRNAAVTMHGVVAARDAAGEQGRATLLIVAQFLVPADMRAFQLPPATLRWGVDAWSAGEPALGPVPLSSYDVLDAILRHLADPAILPDLTEVVVAGHSAGGQMVQRYAVVGHDDSHLAARGIHVRYVVANPSSYLYFSDDRPEPVDAASCPVFNRWRFGLTGAPAYVGAATGLEERYAARDVVYLLGTADIDPNHAALDKSCGAEAQGPYRLARGQAFFAYLKARHPRMTTQHLVLVPGVAHSSVRMFGSACGMAALFESAGCSDLPP
jgi:pimeloyl-ACP methyl ester carboxylesterase